MKTLRLFLVSLCTAIALAANAAAGSGSSDLNGAWQLKGNPGRILLILDGYLSFTLFEREPAQFTRTHGGPFDLKDGRIAGKLQFDSADAKRVGQDFAMTAQRKGDELTLTQSDGTKEVWQRSGHGWSDALTGIWRTVSRNNETGAVTEPPLRPRRTLKILVGGRFQWAAINIETGEFFGTGGGTYTFENGKYTEHLEFFSRDNSRVGMSLGFDAEVKDGRHWFHTGKSSKGNPINEVWAKL